MNIKVALFVFLQPILVFSTSQFHNILFCLNLTEFSEDRCLVQSLCISLNEHIVGLSMKTHEKTRYVLYMCRSKGTQSITNDVDLV